MAFAGTYTTNFGWIHGLEDHFLGHSWSLALEEQFYIIWPPLLIGGLHIAGRRVTTASLAALIGLMILVRLAGGLGPYSVLKQRPDALLLGCLGGLVRWRWPWFEGSLATRQDRSIQRSMGLVAAFLLCLFVSALHNWARSGIGLSATAICALVVILHVVADPGGPLARVLSISIFGEIGKRSYGLYLWHLPIFRWVALQDLDWPDPINVAAKVSATFAIA